MELGWSTNVYKPTEVINSLHRLTRPLPSPLVLENGDSALGWQMYV